MSYENLLLQNISKRDRHRRNKENDIKTMVKDELRKNPHFFYKNKILNSNRNTCDTRRLYTEVIAEELINNYKEVEKIGNNLPIRKRSFNCRHTGEPNVSARLKKFECLKYSEKLLAIALYNSENNYHFGRVFDYEVPLKETVRDKFGKIDLVVKDESTHSIKLIELKINTKETLLRALLEIYTYYKLITNSLDKFLKDYGLSNGFRYFQPVILTDKESLSGQTITDIASHPYLRKFILEINKEIGINIKLFVYDYKNRGKPFRLIGKKIYLEGGIEIKENKYF